MHDYEVCADIYRYSPDLYNTPAVHTASTHARTRFFVGSTRSSAAVTPPQQPSVSPSKDRASAPNSASGGRRKSVSRVWQIITILDLPLGACFWRSEAGSNPPVSALFVFLFFCFLFLFGCGWVGFWVEGG